MSTLKDPVVYSDPTFGNIETTADADRFMALGHTGDVLPVIGDAIGWVQNLDGSLDYERNLANMQRANEYNAWMASTQHQREVEDMRKAGLNPYLSYGSAGSAALSSDTPTSRSSSSGGTSLFSSFVNGAFQLARQALNNDRLEEIAELRATSAYQLQKDRQEFYSNNPYDYYRSNSPKKSFEQHKLTKKDFDNLYTDFSKLKI